MTTEFCFTNGAAYGIGVEIAKASLIDGNRVASAGRKPLVLNKSSNIANSFLPVPLKVTRTNQPEMAVSEPIIAVVFTVGGSVVYETNKRAVRLSDQINV